MVSNNGLLPQTSASFKKTLLEGTYSFKVIARDAGWGYRVRDENDHCYE